MCIPAFRFPPLSSHLSALFPIQSHIAESRNDAHAGLDLSIFLDTGISFALAYWAIRIRVVDLHSHNPSEHTKPIEWLQLVHLFDQLFPGNGRLLDLIKGLRGGFTLPIDLIFDLFFGHSIQPPWQRRV